METVISNKSLRYALFRCGGREEETLKTLRLSEIEPGMILARDIKGRFGRGLLQAGNTITAKHIKIFKSWGITEVDIVNSDSPQEKPVNPSNQTLHDPTERQVKELFKYNDLRHSVIKELFRIALKRRNPRSPTRDE